MQRSSIRWHKLNSYEYNIDVDKSQYKSLSAPKLEAPWIGNCSCEIAIERHMPRKEIRHKKEKFNKSLRFFKKKFMSGPSHRSIQLKLRRNCYKKLNFHFTLSLS